MTPGAPPFVAHAAKLRLVVAMASFLPLLVIGAIGLPLLPGAPLAVRVIGWIILSPLIVFFGVAFRILALRHPVLEIDRHGLLWRRWSGTRIPWDAFERWQARSLLGQDYVTFWLKDRRSHPAGTINGWLGIGNRWLGYGDITINPGGTDRDFGALVAALRAHAPPPPLPEDPRTARRLLAARARQKARDEAMREEAMRDEGKEAP